MNLGGVWEAIVLAVPTSLVPNAPIGGSLDRCPSWDGWWWFQPSTGERRPTRCRRSRCVWCGPINAMLVACAIDLAAPDRFVTFTQVGDTWHTRRQRVRDLTRVVRKAGYDWNLAWHVEPNPKGTGHHFHGSQYGDYVPQAELSRAADSVGMGRVVDIRAVRRDRARVAHYGLKLATAAYSMKLARDDSLETYLQANGGRLVHTTRGFFRDALNGGESLSQRKAIARAVELQYGEGGKWVRIRDGVDLDSVRRWAVASDVA